MKTLSKRKISGKAACVVWAALTALSSGTALAQSASTPAQEKGIWDSASDTVTKIEKDGKWDLYLSGYAKHFHAKRDDLNEKVYGLGIGKTYRNAQGDDESLFFIANRDSFKKPEYMAGYAYQWISSTSSGLEFGAGYSLFLMSRSDVFDRVPFPAILPIASVGTKQYKLMASYAPFKPGSDSHTSVLVIFGKVTFD
jgi:hypothetical protein